MKKLKIALGIIFCLSLGIASGYSTSGAINNWYQYLIKPNFNPPNWLFGPVWTVLYILMGIALGLIWNSHDLKKKLALLLFMVQFALNLGWSFLFFNLHLTDWAFYEIIVMFCLIGLTIFAFYPINKTAAYILIPYLLWVGFASILNGAIWYLNS